MKRRNRTVDHDRRAMQARQTHRRRKALGRALHQAKAMGPMLVRARAKAYREGRALPQMHVPKMLRRHGRQLMRAAIFGY